MLLPSSPPNQFPYHNKLTGFPPAGVWYIPHFGILCRAQHSRTVRLTVTCILFLEKIENTGFCILSTLYSLGIYGLLYRVIVCTSVTPMLNYLCMLLFPCKFI